MSLQFARKSAEKLTENLSIENLPIDPKEMAIRHKVPVYEEDLEKDVSGLLVWSNNRASIFVNKTEEKKRQRFSIAHELGHYILCHYAHQGDHVHVDQGVRILQRNAKSSEGVDSMEIEANQFAASILMPSHLIRIKVEEVSGGKTLDEQMIPKIAESFAVSVQAMTIRLVRLGYL